LLLIALVGSLVLAQSAVTAQEFDVASVKANKSGLFQSSIRRTGGQIVFDNVPLRECIYFAYGIGVDQDYALSGPAWLNVARYDIVAKAPPDTPREQVQSMLRKLLAESFKLRLHRKSSERRVYALVVAHGGHRLKRTSDAEGSFNFRSGHIVSRGFSMSEFANRLSGPVFKLGVPVQDSTGLTGTFDFTLDWAPDDQPAGDAVYKDAAGASLFTAIQEQLGLKLESRKSLVEVWVVDRVEKLPLQN
jgi:uncharacterized protein (TIGR03435 family)